MIEEISKICKIELDVDLKKYNTFKLESKCFLMAFPKNENELIELIKLLKKNKYKFFIIGNGSNIILPDYYDGVIIKLSNLNNWEIKDDVLYAESGCMINKLASDTASLGYSGIDFATGIPGTIGGSIYGNAGCFGSSISDTLISIKVFDGKDIIELSNKDLCFGYRTSMLKEDKSKKYIIISGKFKLEKKDKNELKELILERTNKRVSSQDLKNPSNGSMFRNPEGTSAGLLIDNAGLKGFCVNDAMVSLKHANFIINKGNAKQEDIIKLVEIIKEKIKEKNNIDLVLEQEIIK